MIKKNKKQFEKVLNNLEVLLLISILLFIPLLKDSNLFLSFELIKIISFRVLTSILFFVVLVNRILFGNIQHFFLLEFLRKRKWLFGLLAILGFFILISLINSPNSITALWGNYDKRMGIYTFIHLLVFIHLIVEVVGKSKKQLFELLPIFLLVPLAINLKESIDQRFYGELGFGPENPRVIGTFGQSNFLAGFVNLVLPFQLYFLIIAKKNQVRIFQIVGIGMSLALIILTNSRMGLVLTGLVCELFVVLFVALRFGLKKVRLGKVLVALIIVLFGLNSAIVLGINRFKIDGFIDSGRVEIWSASINLAKDSPILGYGFDVSGYLFPTYMYEGGRGDPLALDRAHNELIDITLNIGLIGLVLELVIMGYMVIGLIKRIIRKNSAYEDKIFWITILTSLSVFCIRSLVNVNGIIHYIFFSFVYGITILENIKLEKVKNKEFKIMDKLKIVLISFIFLVCTLNILLNIKFYLGDFYYNKYRSSREVEDMQKSVYYNSVQVRYSLELLQARLLSKQNFKLEDAISEKFFDEEIYWAEFYSRIGKYYELNGYNKKAFSYYEKALELEWVKESYRSDYERVGGQV